MLFDRHLHTFAAAKASAEAEQRFFRAGMWFKAALLDDTRARGFCVTTKGLSIEKAQSEGMNTVGGFLVPDEIEDLIIAHRSLAGVFRRNARETPMASDKRNAPVRDAALTAYFAAEAATMTESNFGLGSIGLLAKKAYTFTKMSSELDEDAVGLGAFMTEEIGFAFADKEDACGFNADGSPTYGGMTGITTLLLDGSHDAGKVTAAAGHDTFAELDASDLASLIAALPEQYLLSAKWYASGYGIANTFARLGMTTGGLVMTAAGLRPSLSFGGFPIEPTPKLPGSGDHTGAAMILFGDLRASSTLGTRRGVTVKASEHLYFSNDQLAVMGTERFDLNNHNLGNNSTAGAIVGLVGGA